MNDVPDRSAKYKTNHVIDYKLSEMSYVNEDLKNGWELYGSPVCNSNDRIWQAMVKYEIITIDEAIAAALK